MMSFTTPLASMILALILQEAPNVARNDKLQSDFAADIKGMLDIHEEVADGSLINEDFDVLLLAAVNYRENRMRLPAPDGDCNSFWHPYAKVPSGDWPVGYKPVFTRRCNSVGPMQVGRSSAAALVWSEVRSEFPEKFLTAQDRPRRISTFSEGELRDPKTNVKIAYAIIQHWRNTCRDSNSETAPAGVWLTAYRYGRCPPRHGKGYYIDREASTRCGMANSWAAALSSTEEGNYSGPADVQCGYESRVAVRE
jgi:hypothetical protein